MQYVCYKHITEYSNYHLGVYEEVIIGQEQYICLNIFIIGLFPSAKFGKQYIFTNRRLFKSVVSKFML